MPLHSANRESSVDPTPSDINLHQNTALFKSPSRLRRHAREYGLVEQTIYKWIHRYEPFAKNEQGETVTQADVKAMQRRIAELEMENEILKKATAIFAKTK